LARTDFPPNVANLAVAKLTLYVVRANGFDAELTVTALRHEVDGQVVEAGPVPTSGGIVGTGRPAGAPWLAFTGANPTGDWGIHLEDTAAVRSAFTADRIQDLVLVMTLSGTTPAWP